MTKACELTWAFVDPLTDPSWQMFVQRSPGANVFHTSQWARVLHDSYRFRPMYLMGSRGGSTVAAIPLMEVASPFTGRRGVSLPFSDFTDCFLAEHEDWCGVLENLRDIGQARHWRYLELRGGDCASCRFEEERSYYEHVISLRKSEEELSAGLRSRFRSYLRGAEGNKDLRVTTDRSLESVRAFYRLHCLTRRRHRLPPQPFRFFRNLHQHLLSQDMGFVANAYFRDRLIASQVFLHYKGDVLYKYGASDSRFNDQNANKLLLWAVIKKYRGGEFDRLSLGRTEPYNKGLLQFKEGWGAETRLRHYTRLVFGESRRATWGKEEEGSRLIPHLPVLLLRGLSAIAYRHFA
jgi:hypothetical protein